MRTTIELKAEHRARLLQLAAERGEKGFSSLINEAVDVYLKTLAEREQARSEALKLLGSLSAKDADELRESVRKVRGHWR